MSFVSLFCFCIVTWLCRLLVWICENDEVVLAACSPSLYDQLLSLKEEFIPTKNLYYMLINHCRMRQDRSCICSAYTQFTVPNFSFRFLVHSHLNPNLECLWGMQESVICLPSLWPPCILSHNSLISTQFVGTLPIVFSLINICWNLSFTNNLSAWYYLCW